MKVRPMIFNSEMVKALIAGDKVVTRRPVSPQPEPSGRGYDWWPSNKLETMVQVGGFEEIDCDYKLEFVKETVRDASPIANVGDLIYVRETFRLFNNSDECGCSEHCSCPPTGTPIYLATSGDDSESKWKPSIHMPRSLSRITLKVTDVRIERVQGITEEQCWKEGVEHIDGQFDIYQLSEMARTFEGTFEDAKSSFACLWNSIYNNWDQNPYVWVIEFEVIHQNIDQYLQSIAEEA